VFTIDTHPSKPRFVPSPALIFALSSRFRDLLDSEREPAVDDIDATLDDDEL
jgi:hypothetical protein